MKGLESVFDTSPGTQIDLPEPLASIYGPLRLADHPDRPHVISNFVTTLDGVTSWNEPGKSGGGEISGFNQHDRLVMGLLRAVSDAVVVGAGTLRSVPRHVWSAQHVYPDLQDVFDELRTRLGKPRFPLQVVVTSLGRIDLGLPVFTSEDVPALVVSAPAGISRLHEKQIGPGVRIVEGTSGTDLLVAAADVLAAIGLAPGSVILVEGGPHLMGDFLAERRIDELFLTLSPQIAGRDPNTPRPSLSEGKAFAPDAPLWGQLTSLKRSQDHLFLRYAL